MALLCYELHRVFNAPPGAVWCPRQKWDTNQSKKCNSNSVPWRIRSRSEKSNVILIRSLGNKIKKSKNNAILIRSLGSKVSKSNSDANRNPVQNKINKKNYEHHGTFHLHENGGLPQQTTVGDICPMSCRPSSLMPSHVQAQENTAQAALSCLVQSVPLTAGAVLVPMCVHRGSCKSKSQLPGKVGCFDDADDDTFLFAKNRM